MKWQEEITAESSAKIEKIERRNDMEVEKIKDIDKPQEFNKKEKPEITPEMKYIKWPKKGKVTREMVSVLLSSIAVSMLIAAGDQTGMHLLDAVMKIF